MAKLRGPLFSMGARGSLANSVTYTRTGRHRIAKRIPSHPDARTALQLAQRRLYGLAIEWWRYLTPAEKETHRSAAAAAGLPIYQYFIKIVMSTVVDHSERHELGGADVINVAGLSGLLADQQTPLIHGDDKHTNVTREVFLPAPEGYVATGTRGSSGYFSLVFGAANADEPNVYFNMWVPNDFVAFLSVKALWTSEAAAGNAYWRIRRSIIAEGEAYDSDVEAPALGATALSGHRELTIQEAANPIDLSDLAVGDLLGLNFQREGTNVLDTINAEHYLFGLLFSYTADH